MSRVTAMRWDLDKTYLVSHFESLRQLIRIPFQKGEDKISVPGVAVLIRSLRRTATERGHVPRIYFLSASPPQIGTAIRDKLDLDGIDYDGIVFKDQVSHLIRGRFAAVREHIGYKLEELLHSARSVEPGTRELLFGDDWESDPFIYALYADIVAGRVGRDDVVELLRRADVNRLYLERIAELIDEPRPKMEVAGLFILRQRPVPAVDLDAFGPRTTWFDNYFECALALYACGHLDREGVVDVAQAVGMGAAELAASFDAVVERGHVGRGYLSPVRRRLRRARLMDAVAAGSCRTRMLAAFRRWVGRAPSPRVRVECLPDYATLVERWSYRGRKEAVHDTHETEGADAGPDHGER